MKRMIRNGSLLIICLVLCRAQVTHAQKYSLLIKGGHVIDPKNNIDRIMDVAITADTIAALAADIDTAQARKVIHAEGMYVTPGLIDIHSHNFAGTEENHYLCNGYTALAPDGFTFRCGVTTVVDAGSSGWRSFEKFRTQTIQHSQTRVLAFLNIVGEGMRGGVYEQNTADMDAKMTALTILHNKQYVVGIKVAHYVGAEWTPVDRAVEAGKMAGVPVMIDFGEQRPALSLDSLFMTHLRPGDIFTHAYAKLRSRMAIVNDQGQLQPFALAARKKGIVFDVGHGGSSFSFSQAIPALKAGFYPSTISTDIHATSMNAGMKDMLNVMSKFLNMGMDVSSVIKASTWEPAKTIQHEELGNLSKGAVADIAILQVMKGKFGFIDASGSRMDGNQKLECELTMRAGRIVYDLNGLASVPYQANTTTVAVDEHASGAEN
ncbi:amidohydrolase/deacetylase family metallohydrolase [Chitinophaga sp. GbtcB8]|uniref:amidohydrolase/deacetylase family metallohydrolase n=1 Tax=Chitinophaga sp. GbtcB8 TaxID=2824753 RepID=UPI0020C64E81|nr:amidohydrolase/deacetylase family metallohydrolase [Chitinophaga sp. GbtcB8]